MMGVHGKCKLENPCESFCLQKAWHAQFLRKEPRLRSRPFSSLASDVKASRNDHPTRDLQTTANRRLARSRLPGEYSRQVGQHPATALAPPLGRSRDDHRWSPPAQIRTSAFTHTALMKDDWRRSEIEDKGAGLSGAVSTVRTTE